MLYAAMHVAATLAIVPAVEPDTLPALLARHGERRGDRVALRHKRRGLWRAVTWAELADGVRRASHGLAAHGFAAGDVLVVAGHVRAPAIVAALAAQAAGGSAVLVDPDGDLRGLGGACFVYAEDAVQLTRLAAAGLAPSLLIVGDRRGADGALDWDGLLAAADQRGGRELPAAAGADAALALGGETFRHRDLLAPAATRLGLLRVGSDDTSAVAAPASWQALAPALIAEWLVAAFTLGIPEDAATADADVAALAPSYLSAPAAWYDRRWDDAARRLPAPGTRRRRLVDGALASTAASGWRRALDRAFVRAPLRGQLGLRAVRVATTSDGAPRPEAAAFFAALGVGVRTVGAIAGATSHPAFGAEPRIQAAGAAG